MSQQTLYTAKQLSEKAGVTYNQARYCLENNPIPCVLKTPMGRLYDDTAVNLVAQIIGERNKRKKGSR